MPAIINHIDAHRIKTHYNLDKYPHHDGGYMFGGPYQGGYLFGGPFINNAPRSGDGIFSSIGKFFKPKSGVAKAVESVSKVVGNMSNSNKKILSKGIKAATSAIDLGTSIGEAVKAKRTADAIKNQHELEKQRNNLLKEKIDDDMYNKIRGDGLRRRKHKK